MRKKNPFKKNKHEIKYHIINSLISGVLVMLGAFTSGNFSFKAVTFGVITSLIVAIIKFRNYWEKEEKEYSSKIFNFATT